MNEQERFEEFFTTFYHKEFFKAASRGDKSVAIDFSVLDKYEPELADRLLNDPDAVLEAANNATKMLDLPDNNGFVVRFKNLPEQSSIRIRNLRSEHIGKFICIDGIVKRASEVKPEVSVAEFECPSCGTKIYVEQKERVLKYPSICVSQDCSNRRGFRLVGKKLHDARWLVVEEPFEIASGEKPGQISCYLRDDLTSPLLQKRCDPGNRLKITGVVRELPLKTKGGAKKIQSDIFIDVNFVEPVEIEWEEIEINKEDIKRIKEFAADPDVYKKLIDSLAPSIYGLDEIKEAILLQLVGGVPKVLPDGIKIRGDIHILLLGDPSVAKSQLLKRISTIIPRGKYVSGKGATGAGLTATVFRDEELMGGWVLEAGAMVLCHKGIICIDEFDKMSKDDQIAMHEALEQQTISIAKASIIATLPAQVSVLAGANPKFSRFDPYRPLIEQTDIPDTLLSRFDLKFALRDVPNKERDEILASHVAETYLSPEVREPEISPEFLKKFIAYVRMNCRPKMTREAVEVLKKFYVEMRSMYSGDTVPITLRQNEALLRLAEASAKVRLAEEVSPEDAERAIRIMKVSLMQFGYDYETGKIDIDRTEGVSSSQRSKIRAILDIIDRLEKEFGKQIPKEEIIAAAEEEGLRDVEDLIQKLKREGMLFEPRHNMIQKV